MQYLQTFVYSNNEIGLKSLKSIKTLIPHIFEFGLNNVRINGGYIGSRLYNSPDVLEELLSTMAKFATKLMKLKITKINLRNEEVIS